MFCGIIGVLLPAIYGLATGIREPRAHDEYSYLLAAETFLSGRLTNPTPPLPEFFEAPHVLIEPTYASKYPPGQALALAFGRLVGGHYIWGVWLGCGLFAAALCWMLQAWTSRPWANAVTIAAVATLGVANYWAQSYWGGMLAAAGTALVFGALRRTWRSPRVLTSVIMAAGAVILANTRMYEGLLVCTPVAAIMAWWFFARPSPDTRTKVTQWLLPVAVVLALGALWMGAYNRAVTGDWLRTPTRFIIGSIGTTGCSSSARPTTRSVCRLRVSPISTARTCTRPQKEWNSSPESRETPTSGCRPRSKALWASSITGESPRVRSFYGPECSC